MLWGHTTYEIMENAWPAVARDEKTPRAMREWAQKLDAKPKYVVSASRRDSPWNNTFRVAGDLHDAVTQLKEKTPRGVLAGSPMLGAALERLGLIDEYRFVVHPVLAGHGPTLFQASSPRGGSSFSGRSASHSARWRRIIAVSPQSRLPAPCRSCARNDFGRTRWRPRRHTLGLGRGPGSVRAPGAAKRWLRRRLRAGGFLVRPRTGGQNSTTFREAGCRS
jgi:dihydrofolate reductase